MLNQNYMMLSEKPLAEKNRLAPTVWQTTNGQPIHDNSSLYGGFNLGLHVQDDPQSVHYNRSVLLQDIQKTHPHITRISWLSQVHGNSVAIIDNTLPNTVISADAQITAEKNTALAIMTADCVPIMLATGDNALMAAVHAGWQGLAKGIIAKTVATLQRLAKKDGKSQDIQAWVGACIGVNAYEVDERVRKQVLAGMNIANEALDTALSATFFIPVPTKAGHYMANLPAITEYQLRQAGITTVVQSGLDSHSDPRFYSYRQQTQQNLPFTGRMATVIFMG